MPAFVCRIEISEILLFLCFVYRASLYNRLQIKPTSYTYFLLYLFSLLYMFRASICPSSGELTVSLWHWYLTLCHSVWMTVRSVQTGQPLIQSDKYQCHKDTVSSPDDGHIVTHTEWQSDKYQCHKDRVSSRDDGHIVTLYEWQIPVSQRYSKFPWWWAYSHSVNLYEWLSGLCRPDSHSCGVTEWQIPVSQRYSKFSWWWAYRCLKHVQKRK